MTRLIPGSPGAQSAHGPLTQCSVGGPQPCQSSGQGRPQPAASALGALTHGARSVRSTTTPAAVAPTARRRDSDVEQQCEEGCSPTWTERRRGTSPANAEGRGRAVAPRLHADDGLGFGRRRQRCRPLIKDGAMAPRRLMASAPRCGAPRNGLTDGRRVGRLRRRGLDRSEMRRRWGRWPASMALGLSVEAQRRAALDGPWRGDEGARTSRDAGQQRGEAAQLLGVLGVLIP
jgi:hypothetical protein